MKGQKSTKVNRLQDLLEEGLLAPTSWLELHGYSRALLSKYVASGWLVSPARGVYRRPGPSLKWQHVVASVQRFAGNVHVGGRTALRERGLSHYVRMRGPETIHLYGSGKLPAWLNRLGLPERFELRSDAMLAGLRVHRDDHARLVGARRKPLSSAQLAMMGYQEMSWGAWDWPLLYATDERAILELLHDVPSRESVYEADVLMEGLANLQPARVRSLLLACTSVKVKRLFLALAERHQHQWLAHVDLTRVDLGKGKRMLPPGGVLHPKYLITLPADLDAHTR